MRVCKTSVILNLGIQDIVPTTRVGMGVSFEVLYQRTPALEIVFVKFFKVGLTERYQDQKADLQYTYNLHSL